MTEHKPAAVLERPDQFWYCLGCSQPWPCPSAKEDNTDE